MKSLEVVISVFLLASAFSIAAATVENEKRKIKIGLMTAGLPWHFGPYQSQMHELSLLLSDVKDIDPIEYDIYWLNYAEPSIPKGVYKNYQELRPHIQTSIPPPEGFPLDHLTFLGKTLEGQMSATELNKLQEVYGLDCLVTLMDISRVVPDRALKIPVLAWIPLHSERVSSATSDYWVLRMYHGIASLAPSSAKVIETAVGKDIELATRNEFTSMSLKKTYGNTQVDFIPHIFDRRAISASANVGLDLLKDYSAAEADAKLNKSPLINRGQESTLEPGHASSLFGKERKDDFVVLLQGGNYDSEDRKGWDTSIQAFVRFYNSLEDPSGVHLLIHAMESYLVSGDVHLDADAPGAILPKGTMLDFTLHQHGLPRHVYTIDIAKHAPQVVAAYKKRADVCLHPSKVEGFGMNVMECQVVGTPVITTNYTAMGDFTKIGRSVPYRQTIHPPNTAYQMAMPDVIGIADALGELYEEHKAMKRGDEVALARREAQVLRFNDWIDETCSPQIVGDKFKALLLRTQQEFTKRFDGKHSLFLPGADYSFGAYETVTGYHAPIVHWDNPWTLLAPDGLEITQPQQLHQGAWNVYLNESPDRTPMVMVLPATYEDGTNVPFMNQQGEIHEDLPVLVSTFMMTAMQGTMSRRKSLVLKAIQNWGEPMMLPQGMAIIDRSKNSGDQSGYEHFVQIENDEL
mmetsp:Transcript_5574/g.13259  ORF Transcript_5574/g.13259 Transcript_5574/m.13259 type:complete len:689 (-) Transcript_5574:226-2292(-)